MNSSKIQSVIIISLYRAWNYIIIGAIYSILTIRINLWGITGNSVCRTPSGLEGVCVGYRKCQFVLDLYERYNDQFPQFFIDYIFKSRCYPEEANVSVGIISSYCSTFSISYFLCCHRFTCVVPGIKL